MVGLVGLEENIFEQLVKVSNATEKEIIIDVPLALKIMSTGFIWPISAWQEYVSGTLLADVSEITVSPR